MDRPDPHKLERIKVTAGKYFVWLLVNFVLCLLPIVISGLIADQYTDDIFLSFIAFIYTLVISSIYSFDSHENRSSGLFWVSIVFSTLALCLFILFPKLLPEKILTGFHKEIWMISFGILCIAILISFFLNKPSIDEQIKKALASKPFREAKQTGQRVGNMSDQLKDEK